LIIKRIESEGLAHFSYLIGSKNESAVIDPRRDCQEYLNIAKREELEIRYIFETHRNEDYVIGSLELANITGAKIYHGSRPDWKYGENINDGQKFQIGDLRLTALHTPGHTDESTSYVLSGPSSEPSSEDTPLMVFTGDILFIGDVGRTDLYGPEETTRLAGELYESIFNKILPLGDEVILYPAHGAGSVCGGAISERKQSTIGLERRLNPLLQKSKNDFIKFKIEEHHERPPYFDKMEQYNLNGPPLIKQLPNPKPLTPKEFKTKIDTGALIIDTRMPPAFSSAHIKGSYNIWLQGVPTFSGWVLPYDKPILLLLEEPEHLEKVVQFLIRLGFDKIEGYLKGSIEAWYSEALPIEQINLLTVQELKNKLDKDLKVLDVREETEWIKGHIHGAIHIYVGQLQKRINEVPKDQPVAVFCSVGNRASLGASVLKRENYRYVYTVLGSMNAWNTAGYPIQIFN
jgi:hydroxyacylglutathione hydrolase